MGPSGGGVAAAARLLWAVMQEAWGPDARLLTLARQRQSHGIPGLGDRVMFGSRLAAAQAFGDVSWTLFAHLSLARVNAVIPRRARKPYAVFLHGIEVWRPLDRVQQRALRSARLLIANSRHTARRAAELHPWLPPIAVCELTLTDDPAAAVARGDVPVAMDDAAVLVVGRLDADERYKGHDQLIDAWPAVVAAIPRAQLVVTGTGNDLDRLRRRAGALGVAASVVFTGFVSDAQLSALYRRAAVFAMPSRNEGFGLVYLEAMAHGLPCVGSIHDAAGEVIEDGVTGVLVDQGDTGALARQLIDLLADPRRRDVLGRAGRRRFESHFSRAAFGRRLVRLLDTAFAGSAATHDLDASGSVETRI